MNDLRAMWDAMTPEQQAGMDNLLLDAMRQASAAHAARNIAAAKARYQTEFDAFQEIGQEISRDITALDPRAIFGQQTTRDHAAIVAVTDLAHEVIRRWPY